MGSVLFQETGGVDLTCQIVLVNDRKVILKLKNHGGFRDLP